MSRCTLKRGGKVMMLSRFFFYYKKFCYFHPCQKMYIIIIEKNIKDFIKLLLLKKNKF